MAVEVDNEGVIDIGGGLVSVKIEGSAVSFTINFNNEEDAIRYRNMLCASLEVRCVHMHFGPMREKGRIH